MNSPTLPISFAALVLALTTPARAADVIPSRPKITDDMPPPSATEVWSPVPPVVSAPAGGIPSDAIVLFDGKDLNAWESVKNSGQAAPWKVEDGAFVVAPKTGDSQTRPIHPTADRTSRLVSKACAVTIAAAMAWTRARRLIGRWYPVISNGS